VIPSFEQALAAFPQAPMIVEIKTPVSAEVKRLISAARARGAAG
jgi:hypothetical protein